jgi:hypothetical protein
LDGTQQERLVKVVQDTLNQNGPVPAVAAAAAPPADGPPHQQEADQGLPRTFRKVSMRKIKEPQQQERSGKRLADTARSATGHQRPPGHEDAGGGADEVRVKAVKVRVKRPEAVRR